MCLMHKINLLCYTFLKKEEIWICMHGNSIYRIRFLGNEMCILMRKNDNYCVSFSWIKYMFIYIKILVIVLVFLENNKWSYA